jgi:hypothetical protein
VLVPNHLKSKRNGNDQATLTRREAQAHARVTSQTAEHRHRTASEEASDHHLVWADFDFVV